MVRCMHFCPNFILIFCEDGGLSIKWDDDTPAAPVAAGMEYVMVAGHTVAVLMWPDRMSLFRMGAAKHVIVGGHKFISLATGTGAEPSIDWGDDIITSTEAPSINWGDADDVSAMHASSSGAIEVVASGESPVIRASLLEHTETRNKIIDEYLEVCLRM